MLLIYGSYGYTGSLIAQLAVKLGIHPVLAGRGAVKLAVQSQNLGLEKRVFSLLDQNKRNAALEGVDVVLNCAGPFSHTAIPLVESCLYLGIHYIDITGEVNVFENLAARDHEAKSRGVMILPGAGYDVVPTDCLAVHLKNRLPSAKYLTLAMQGLTRPSKGTAITAIESLSQPCLIREDGQIKKLPLGAKNRMIDFGNGPVPTTGIAFGDISTAYRSTGIENIETYFAISPLFSRLISFQRSLGNLLASRTVKKTLELIIRLGPRGPSDEQLANGFALLWGEAQDHLGHKVTTRMRTPEPYVLTAQTALKIAEKALAGETRPGFQTPAMAYGADFILQFAGVERVENG